VGIDPLPAKTAWSTGNAHGTPSIPAFPLSIWDRGDRREVDRFTLYDRMKTLAAAPPDVLVADEKNLREVTRRKGEIARSDLKRR
jgi:hypothetical protein